jgi:glycine cleavage system H protein
MNIPEDLKYTNQHEWARIQGIEATVGITDFAQQSLGDVVYVEMPEIGTQVKQDEAFGVVESVKAASDIYSPLSGEVIEVNEALGEHPEYINQSPYEKGWIIKMKIKDQAELDAMMEHREYEQFVQKEDQ